MKYTLLRIAGIALIVAGIAGLVFSIAGLFVLASVQGRIESAALEQLELVDRALAATAEGLSAAEDTLVQASSVVDSLEATMGSVGQAVEDSTPTVDAVAEFLDQQLPATIQSTQETLRSAASSAKLVDDLLVVITALPLLRTDKYNPDVPLNAGLEEVANSLDGIPDALGDAHEGLSAASDSLRMLGKDFAVMADEIGRITASLEGAQSVLAEYQGVVADLQTLASSVRMGLPRWLGTIRLGLSLALIWLGIAQIGLITQGWEMNARARGHGADDDQVG